MTSWSHSCLQTSLWVRHSPRSPALQGDSLPSEPPGNEFIDYTPIQHKKLKLKKKESVWYGSMHAKLLQSCPILCNPMDHSLPGSSVCGILQARILEWVAMPSSRGSSQPRDRTHVSCVSCTERRDLYH